MPDLNTILIALGLLVGGPFALLVVQCVHLALVMRWAEKRTEGKSYYGGAASHRRSFKRLVRMHALLLSPLLILLSKTSPFRFQRASFWIHGVAAPASGVCNPQSFEQGLAYEPQADDVFVVTQMRCGTTWMQHVVFQALTRGARDLAQEDVALNAISPWVESHKTVPVAQAPLVGKERPSRIIKTHLPLSLCPFSSDAKYIYVVRHPASCFASCMDFVRSNLHRFEISVDDFAAWFLDNDAMWWTTWASHFSGWWRQAESHANVLIVRFEDMKLDLPGVIQQVAEFLELEQLNADELQAAATRCSFEQMRKHADIFEMHPPHLLQTPDRFFVSGKLDRYNDVPPAVQERIIASCVEELAAAGVPLHRFYPELAAESEQERLACPVA